MKINATIQMSPALRRLLEQQGTLTNHTGVIANNVDYIYWLEYGTSKMPPRSMIRIYLREYRAMFDEEVHAALGAYGTDLDAALKRAVSTATLRIMRAIADRTRVDTGRAKGGWTATLPGGKVVASGKTITPEEQKAIRDRKRLAKTTKTGQRKRSRVSARERYYKTSHGKRYRAWEKGS